MLLLSRFTHLSLCYQPNHRLSEALIGGCEGILDIRVDLDVDAGGLKLGIKVKWFRTRLASTGQLSVFEEVVSFHPSQERGVVF